MSIKILIVDDSLLFRNYLTAIINSDSELEVIDFATNGEEAVKKVKELNPDVVTMDVNMPVMDGIATIKRIMEEKPTPILMLSVLTTSGAKSTFDTLEAGAIDFLPKDKEFISSRTTNVSADVIAKIKNIAQCNLKPQITKSKYEVILIGSSTGGPIALQTIMRGLPYNFPVPIVIIQHMPENFTKHFAERINTLSTLHVKEAANGDILEVGHVYIAPGGKQLTFKKPPNDAVSIKIEESESSMYYRPSVDSAFTSASKVFGKGKVLSLILTGMGADGREGVRALKKNGATSWIQDEKSSVVFGMPQAILNAGLADKLLSIEYISTSLINEVF